ncbi:threonine/serine dehydratase [Virgibacillus sp. C22-A2]|uniref:Threonine/serine dehydratase n=1 Tax=Virgibacillus tibetensis TaxID=3042313 RepID=A0ABU6KCZ4_9BACI|nr:threonine/serine dehydratase [Virgibacillus sp. C22-A2]
MVTIKDIHQARERISTIINETPILSSSQLSNLCGNSMFFKAEHLQKTGAFKVRGATNKVMYAAAEGVSSVTAASSGNHGQAVAYIANILGVPATIVVPEDANASKVSAIRSYNGSIETCGTTSDERIPRAEILAKENGGVFIPPYDDPLVIAGQGTVGLEILEQLELVEAVVVPIGGGGLISGILTAVKEIKPSVKIIGVEPVSANDTYLSLKNRQITSIQKTNTIADGLRTSQPGSLTFPIVEKYIDNVVLVSEDEISQALFFVLERMKQLIEPSSAVTVAAAMFDKLNMRDKNVVCVLSGGNVDLGKIGHMM